MDFPTLDEIRRIRDTELADRQDDPRKPLLPICVDVLADMDTPVSAYCKTARGPYSFLLQRVAGGERIARYSFIGINPYLVMTQRGDTATLRRVRASESGKDDINHAYMLEQVDCHDPLNFIQAELGQYRLVTSGNAGHDALPVFH